MASGSLMEKGASKVKNLIEFFSEMKSIQDSREPDEPVDDEIDESPQDEGENESEFLQEIGLELVASQIKAGQHIDAALLAEVNSTMTPSQVATIKRHMSTLIETRRHKAKSVRPDIRDIFQSDTDGPVSSSHFAAWVGGEENTVTGISISLPESPLLKGTGSRKEPEVIAGQTNAADYSKKDLMSVRKLALLDLATLFYEHKIVYHRRKTKRKPREHGVFGVPLQTLLDRDQKKNPSLRVPLVFQQLITRLEKNYLSVEGLLRVPGSLTRIKKLRQEFDNQQDRGSHNLDEGVTAHDVAGLLKLFIRELPTPILTLERVDAFMKVLTINSRSVQIAALNLLILALPDVNRDTLQMLLAFLGKVVACLDNRMTLESVSMVIAPNLFLVGGGAGSLRRVGGTNSEKGAVLSTAALEVIETDMKAAVGTSSIIEMLIEHQDVLFTVPDPLITQVREQNEQSKMKIIKGLFSGRKDRPSGPDNGSMGCSAQVMVSLEESSVEVPITIDDKMLAQDLIVRVCASPRQHRHGSELLIDDDSKGRSAAGSTASASADLLDRASLYEVGGNIGEYRLCHRARMTEVWRKNPQAKYVIRMKPQHLL